MKMKSIFSLVLLLCAIGAFAQAPITGTTTVCTGRTTTLSNSNAGGTWSSANTAIATVGSSTGIVVGEAAGSATISYTVSGLTSVATVTVLTSPPDITGPSSVCESYSVAMTGGGNGSWSSSNPAVCSTISGRNFRGVSAGTAVISYNADNSACYSLYEITVKTTPTISGKLDVCVGQTQQLIGTPGGGTWNSSNSGNVTVGSTGIITGVTHNTGATITYTSSNGCFKTAIAFAKLQTVAAITGSSNICAGTSATFQAGGTLGGSWVSSNTAVATVSALTPGYLGSATGISAGTVIISYELISSGCRSVKPVTVDPLPTAITGPSTVPLGSTITLSNTAPGGVWSSAHEAIATVGATTGIVSGLSLGLARISYSMPSPTCWATTTITVVPAISGATSLCEGTTTTLTGGPSGGTWSSSNTSIATISSTGVVTAVSAGTVHLTYTASSYSAVHTLTVHETPVLSGASYVCEESTVTLTSDIPGGTWSSNNTAKGPIGETTGIMTGGPINPQPSGSPCFGDGVGSFSITLTYTTANGCSESKIVEVRDIIDPVTYPSTPICAGLLRVVQSSACSGGPIGSGGAAWTSANTAIATIGSNNGHLVGVSAGTVTISHTRGNSCYRTAVVTVSPTYEAEITGSRSVCEGGTSDLDCTESGGTWTSNFPAKVSVNSSTGVITGITSMYSNGNPEITYVLASGACKGVNTTVNSLTISESPITMCTSATRTLSYPGSETGTWSSTNTAVATVSGTGTTCVVTGVGAGTAQIVYQLDGSVCKSSVDLTVNCVGKPGGSANDPEPEVRLIANNAGFTILPNPNSGKFVISTVPNSGVADVTIINYLGATIYSGQLNFSTGEASLNLDKAAPGLYMLELKAADGMSSIHKVVIQR